MNSLPPKNSLDLALVGLAQWTGRRPENLKVAGLSASQGTCLGCRLGPQLGAYERQLIDVSLPLPPSPLSLKIINKIFKTLLI